jgi:hypothetical protein
VVSGGGYAGLLAASEETARPGGRTVAKASEPSDRIADRISNRRWTIPIGESLSQAFVRSRLEIFFFTNGCVATSVGVPLYALMSEGCVASGVTRTSM